MSRAIAVPDTEPALVVPETVTAKTPRRRVRLRDAGPLTYGILVVALAVSAFPLYFMLVMASRPNDQITTVPPPLSPGDKLVDNVQRVFANPDVLFSQAMVNTLIVAGVCSAAVVLCSSLAGFAFAKLRFRGRDALLLTVIATMMVPVQLGFIPLYMLMTKLNLVGQLPAVILPFVVSGFGVFMMRQYAGQAVPDELIEAARIDGASTIRIFWSVVLPALRPAAAVLGLFTFMERWNDFLWPYLVLSPEHPTVQVALSRLSNGYYADQALVIAGTLVGTLPLAVVFVVFGRQIIGGIMEAGIKA